VSRERAEDAPDTTDAVADVRPAVRADLFEVARIERASFSQPWPHSAFERFLGEPGFLVAAAPEESDVDSGPVSGTVVGYVVADCVRGHGGTAGHVKDLAVHPDHRSRGVGSTLLDTALSRLREQGATTAKLEVRPSNAPARSLYERHGFDALRSVEGYYDDGENALIYVRGLDDDAFEP
jgi:ribosomal-protein-alanine N-acetyltransferase